MGLPKFNELSDFQKWFLFYLVKNTKAPKSLAGILPQMCLTVKMNIDVDKFDSEQDRLRKEANQLVDHTLLHVSTFTNPNGEYMLTEKGELYIFQKILGPIIKIKDKGALQKIRQYISKDASDVQNRVLELITDMNTNEQKESLLTIANRILGHAMPYLDAIARIHQVVISLGL